MDITVLGQTDVEKIFTMDDAIKASKDALEIYSKGESDIPLRTILDVKNQDAESIYMPGYAESANALGLKIVSVFPNNNKKGLNTVPATMILVDEETGEVSSLIDGTYLTQLRTGAVSGAATDLLAKKDSKTFAIIGTGGQAPSQIEAVLSVRDIEIVKVYNRKLEKAEAFAKDMTEKFSGKFKAKIVAAASPEEAIEDADIITTVTTAKKPVFDGKYVKKGAHINAVGSFKPDMQEIDEYIMMNADKIYVDTRDGVLNESGDFLRPIQNGNFKEKDIAGELGEVIIKKASSRESDEEITLFKTVGSGILDIVTARRIYENAKEKNIGQIIKF